MQLFDDLVDFVTGVPHACQMSCGFHPDFVFDLLDDPDRIGPRRPHGSIRVTETKEGARALSWVMVSKSFFSPSSVLGGKNSKEKVCCWVRYMSLMRIIAVILTKPRPELKPPTFCGQTAKNGSSWVI